TVTAGVGVFPGGTLSVACGAGWAGASPLVVRVGFCGAWFPGPVCRALGCLAWWGLFGIGGVLGSRVPLGCVHCGVGGCRGRCIQGSGDVRQSRVGWSAVVGLVGWHGFPGGWSCGRSSLRSPWA